MSKKALIIINPCSGTRRANKYLTDIVDIFEAINDETLADLDIEWDDRACSCVIMAFLRRNY